MNHFLTFASKEWTEHLRTKRALIAAVIFVLFAIANPAIALLTPVILKESAEALASSGITVSEIEITAMDSWLQFINNTSTVLAAFLIIFSGTFTKEYQNGTLIPLLTKGLRRTTIIHAKSAVLMLLWGVGFWCYFGITYGYTAYYWDQSVIHSVFFVGGCWWLLGIFWICLLAFFSSFLKNAVQVIAAAAGVYMIISTIRVLKTIQPYLPTHLEDSHTLLTGESGCASYLPAILVTAAAAILLYLCSLILTKNKQL